MKVYTSASEYNNERSCVVTIGTFDGVHIGHQAILKRLVKTAKKKNLDATLLTFFPHPRLVLQKDASLKLINTISEKKALLERTGLDHLIVHPFTKSFSRLSSVEFVRDILVHQLKAKKIIIGYDHRFGRNRTATIDDLKEFGKIYNFKVAEIGVQELDEIAISSTKIRNALSVGDITTANNYLGYPFVLSGTVVKGNRVGRTIDFPTANLYVSETHKLIPTNGVYVVSANINSEKIYGITNIGTNPTVGGKHQTIETYFLDFNQDLYNTSLQLEFITHIRDEENFDGISSLKKAIQNDEKFAREYIKRHE